MASRCDERLSPRHALQPKPKPSLGVSVWVGDRLFPGWRACRGERRSSQREAMNLSSSKSAPEPDPVPFVRPGYNDRVSVNQMREVIKEVLHDKLAGKEYEPSEASNQTREIVDEIRSRLQALPMARYKYMVQAVIGEQRGGGFRMGNRCFWDADTDNFATEKIVTDSLFCVAVAWAVYTY
eukprot:CAMPEP_0118859114 /NCGR_PEP_ID=MMETSP1163-20130328/5501_1 /TAXON_ID=124430 /ORGANISM="Phaeomonas parva, Strain CCMP2877" /LENGTH=180 /DNA_ID=CAMNT_0006792655 /DNA_START=1 /DNA_END=544 /DNA_ORIENTATION=-